MSAAAAAAAGGGGFSFGNGAGEALAAMAQQQQLQQLTAQLKAQGFDVVPTEGMPLAARETLAAAQNVYRQHLAVQCEGVATGMVLLVSHGHASQKRYAFACQVVADGKLTFVHSWLQGDVLDCLCASLSN
jgi:hypothetical protein